MSSRRGLGRLVDPWAALVLGVLVALGVVILLSTPGPWHRVGPAPVRLAKQPPADIAVYVRAGLPQGRCTTVAWLHVEYDQPAFTVVLVPPELEVPVARGGFAPVGRLVGDAGAKAATAGLSAALQTPLGGWLVMDGDALRRLLVAARAPGTDRLGMPGFRQAIAALRDTPVSVAALAEQQRVLTRTLPAIPFGLLNQAAMVNYVLGSTDADTSLDLRATSAMARAVRGLRPSGLAVRTLPAIVERCGPSSVWRPDWARAERLRLSLEYGLQPPRSAPQVAERGRRAEVVVVAPQNVASAALTQGLRPALRREADGPLAVRLAPLPSSPAAAAGLLEQLAAKRPLAVVVAPWPASGPASSAASPSPAPSPSSSAGDGLAALLAGLAAAWQPAVVVASDAGLVPAPAPAPAPVVVLPPPSGGETQTGSTPREQARLVADAVQRACWPGYLAPGLSGTQAGFSYAARGSFTLAVLSPDSALDLTLMRRLTAAGYSVRPLDLNAWQAPVAGTLVAYAPGHERAARALRGDVANLSPGLRPRRGLLPLFIADDAPEAVTLVLAE